METASSSEEEKTAKEEPEQPEEESEPIKTLPESVLVSSALFGCARFYYLLCQRFIEMQEARMEAPMPKVEIDSLNTRSYLDHTVVPVMMDAMAAVARQR